MMDLHGLGDVVSSLFIMLNQKTYILFRIEFLVVITTLVFLAMFIMDFFRRQIHDSTMKTIFRISDAVSDSIVLYLLGAMQTAPFKNQLFPVWALVLVSMRHSADYISGHGVHDCGGRRYNEFRNVVKLLGSAFLNWSHGSSFVIPLWLLWALQIVRTGNRFWTYQLALNSVWHGNGSQLVSEYMRADNGRSNWKNLKDCNLTTMKGYTYLVYGETHRSIKLKKPEYTLYIEDDNPRRQRARCWRRSVQGEEDTSTLITLDKIWERPLWPDGNQAKDLSLAFALSRLLRCRLEGVTLHGDTFRINRNLVKARIVEETDTKRAFRVMELQLAFLSDYLNSRYPMVFWRGLSSLYSYLLLSVVTFGVVCWLAVDIRKVYKPPEGELAHVEHGSNVDVIITWVFMFFMVFKEIWEAVTYLLSDWTRLLLVCSYARSKGEHSGNGCTDSVKSFFLKSKITDKRWHEHIDQYVFLESYNDKPKFWNFMHKLTTGVVPAKDDGAKLGSAIRVPEYVRSAILEKLREIMELPESVNSNKNFEPVATDALRLLPKAITSLPHESEEWKRYGWACFDLPTCSHIILVWHIATSLCEMELAMEHDVNLNKPRDGFMGCLWWMLTCCCPSEPYLIGVDEKKQENKLPDRLQEKYIIANSLSRYCAYLLVSMPDLIPDDFLVPKMLFQKAVKDARDGILDDCGTLQRRYDKLMGEPGKAVQDADIVKRREDVLRQGAMLAKELIAHESKESLWDILAGVWADLLVHLAPSWNAAAHKSCLGSGGEFITHIWALLWHCGIEKSSLWPEEDAPGVPQDNNPDSAGNESVDNGAPKETISLKRGSGMSWPDLHKCNVVDLNATTKRAGDGEQEKHEMDAELSKQTDEEVEAARDKSEATTPPEGLLKLKNNGKNIQTMNGEPSNSTAWRSVVVVDAGKSTAEQDQLEKVEMKPLKDGGRNVVRRMKNLGHTCYFNAVLQSLLALDELHERMLGQDAPTGPLGKELKKLFLASSDASDAADVLEPDILFSVMCSRNGFKVGQMEDSNDMLLYLLDGLKNEQQFDASKQIPTMVESLFYCKMDKQVTCRQCKHTSNSTEVLLNLNLAIPSEKPASIEGCLDLYTVWEASWHCKECSTAAGNASPNQTNATVGRDQTEQFDSVQAGTPNQDKGELPKLDGNSYQIHNGKIAEVHYSIRKAPHVLTIQLKRFSFDDPDDPDDPDDRPGKLIEHVIFQETLDITKFMHLSHGNNDECKYHLVAVIVHEGPTLQEGHYFAYVRARSIRGQQWESSDALPWFRASDESITEVSLEEVLNCQAYILFYERVELRKAKETHPPTNQ